MELFKLHNNIPVLARVEIGLYREFNNILRRDRGSKGDIDGRKKFIATKEFHYIYLTTDYDSHLRNKGYTGKELRNKAKEEAELPDKWKEDTLIKEAIAKYEDLNFDTKKELITELLILFRANIKIVSKLRKDLDKLLDAPFANKTEAGQIMSLQERLFEIAAGIPYKIKTLTQALKDVEAISVEQQEELRGGGEIPESADPSRAKS